jgi:hypothetical protein
LQSVISSIQHAFEPIGQVAVELVAALVKPVPGARVQDELFRLSYARVEVTRAGKLQDSLGPRSGSDQQKYEHPKVLGAVA